MTGVKVYDPRLDPRHEIRHTTDRHWHDSSGPDPEVCDDCGAPRSERVHY